ncbi:hypothetical protein MNBD_PLANCTO02-2767 [hydrothermal vent metagenome]|uniref:RND efflux pump membrane fusion protein barrel-sandwich domain-containing protein n=1 Tax=hydrothermal vent metagenome TaxID=652676 RepID=A0A3B1DX89_9ZZZZ
MTQSTMPPSTTPPSTMSKSTMSKVASIISPLIVVAVSLLGYVVLVAQKKAPGQKVQADSISVVETIPVTLFNGHIEIKLDGTVTPLREITLSAEVAGRVEKKSPRCRAGKYLAPSSFILKIDSQDYDIEFNSLIKDLEEAAVVLKELEVEVINTNQLIELAEEDLKLQQKEMKRIQKLRERNVATGSQLDKANQILLVSKRSLEMQRNQYRLLGTKRFRLYRSGEKILLRLKQAYLNQQRTTITSPVRGIIVKDHVEQGEYVKKGDPLVTIEETSAVEIRCNLKMDELYWIRQQSTSNQKKVSIKSLSKKKAKKRVKKKTDSFETFNKQVADHERLRKKLDQLLAQVSGDNFDDIHRPLMRLVEDFLKEESSLAVNMSDASGQISDVSLKQRISYELPLTPVKVTYQLNDEIFSWEGELSRFDGAGLDEKTRTIPCRVIVRHPLQSSEANKKGLPALIRGMFVNLIMEVQTDIPLYQIPIQAIHPGAVIWVAKKGKLHIQPVSIIRQTSEYALVRVEKNKIMAGDNIIISPLATVEEGLPVKVKGVQ